MADSNTPDSSKARRSKARRWSKPEDDVLTKLVNQLKRGSAIDWRKVAQELPDRSNKDCRKRWLKIDGKWRQGQWSQAEDKALVKAVQQQTGKRSWKLISDKVATRNPDQCSKRYKNSLDPNLDKTPWTPADDARLIDAVAAVGGKHWRRIAEEYFPNRARLDLSNHWVMLERKRGQSNSASAATAAETSSSTPDDEDSPTSQSPQTETEDGTESYTEADDEDVDDLRDEEMDAWNNQHYSSATYTTGAENHTSYITSMSGQASEPLHTQQYTYDSLKDGPTSWYHPSVVEQQIAPALSNMPSPSTTSYEYYNHWPNQWHESGSSHSMPGSSIPYNVTTHAGHHEGHMPPYNETAHDHVQGGQRQPSRSRHQNGDH